MPQRKRQRWSAGNPGSNPPQPPFSKGGSGRRVSKYINVRVIGHGAPLGRPPLCKRGDRGDFATPGIPSNANFGTPAS